MRTAAALMGDIGMLRPLRRKDIETGRKLEREAIIKWLREAIEPYPDALDIADEIEAGEHLK